MAGVFVPRFGRSTRYGWCAPAVDSPPPPASAHDSLLWEHTTLRCVIAGPARLIAATRSRRGYGSAVRDIAAKGAALPEETVGGGWPGCGAVDGGSAVP
jgi:hypothetical protein